MPSPFPGTTTTVLRIDDIDFSDYSTRALTMVLTPIEASHQLARDCRGTLIDISLEQFRKYEATITCTDQEAPTFTDVWPGKLVTVSFIPNVGVEGVGGTDTDSSVTMTMRVVDWQTSTEEYEASCAWQLDLEEV